MNEHTFKVSSPHIGCQGTLFELDGKPLDGVTKMSYACVAYGVNRINVEIVSEVVLDVVAELSVSTVETEQTHDLLRKLMERAMLDVSYEGGDETASVPDESNDIGAVAIRFMEILIEESGPIKA